MDLACINTFSNVSFTFPVSAFLWYISQGKIHCLHILLAVLGAFWSLKCTIYIYHTVEQGDILKSY